MKTSTSKRSPLGSDSCSPSFIPFDDSWKKEVLKHRKADIVDMLKSACNDRDFAMEENQRLLMGLESATIRRHDDGRIELVDAPDVFACSRQCLEQLIARISSENVQEHLTADATDGSHTQPPN